MTDNTLGQRIAEGRKKLGLSQEAFGDRLGVSRQAASKWESDASVPEIDKLITMSKLFGVPIGWLLGVENPAVEPSLSEEQLSAVTELLCRYPTPCPERKNRRWLFWICAGGVAACLVLGCLGLFFPKNQVIDADTLEQQLEALAAENDGLEQQLKDQSALNTTLEKQLKEQSDDLDYLEAELNALKITDPGIPGIDSNGTPTTPETVYPGNDLLKAWTLSPKINSSKNFTTLWFSGFTDTAYETAELVAVLNDQDTFTAVCAGADTGYTAELNLPNMDGYTYYFRVTDAEGNQQTVELVGHGLSNLDHDTEPFVTFSSRGVGMSSEKFWLEPTEITLGAPPVIPYDQVTWSELRITYYCDDSLVAERSLMSILGNQSIHDPGLEFTLYSLGFDLASKSYGSRHSLYVEGSIITDTFEYTFSEPLVEWILRGDELKEV